MRLMLAFIHSSGCTAQPCLPQAARVSVQVIATLAGAGETGSTVTRLLLFTPLKQPDPKATLLPGRNHPPGPASHLQHAYIPPRPQSDHLAFCSRAEYSVSDTREASMSLVRPVLAEYLKMKAFISSYL